jgi:hypothetical protein
MCRPNTATLILLAVLVLPCAVTPATAQYTAITTPIHTVSDSFFENMNVGFGMGINGAGFLPGDDRGPGATIGLDPTGAPTPNLNLPYSWGGGRGGGVGFGGGGGAGGATFGFGMGGSGFNTGTNLGFSQGSSRSMVMQAPTVVIPNGGQGTIIDTIQRPFVTGYIPVVGGAGAPVIVGGYGVPGFGQPVSPPVSPLFERIQRLKAQGGYQRHAPDRSGQRAAGREEPLAMDGGRQSAGPSTAERGDLSVAEIRRQQAAERDTADKDLATWIERARGAEAAGKTNVARIYYRMAAGRATGELKQQMIAKYRELGGEQP